jgi:GH15 family glucan-1,4-alpha-glucosidase
MPSRIEDYALLGDCRTAALVGRDGSIDWLCLPRFDSGACFATLLGEPKHGRWLLAPAGGARQVRRRYRPGTLVLETDFETDAGLVTVVDCMLPFSDRPVLVRQVEGKRGQVAMDMELVLRFDYGSSIPWMQREEGGIQATSGPDTVHLRTEVPVRGQNLTTVARFTVSEGQQVPFTLFWHPSHQPASVTVQPGQALADTERWWSEWSARCTYRGEWQEAVQRSLITLKALTYAPTGGIVAAATTSLPEHIGGVRNWDYRFCWVRDATLTLYSLMACGYKEEAHAWREWLLRAVAGSPAEMQIMYGLAGERRLPEMELNWLPGYERSAPVRIGNAAARQFQLDVYGELLDALHQGRRVGMEVNLWAWQLELTVLRYLEFAWEEPDEGIWEVRGRRRHFTHSKVMAWVAFDRAVKTVERFGHKGPAEHWRGIRDAIHRQVCRQGFDTTLGSFVQSYGSRLLDASLLLIPLVGFLPPTDPRVRGTVEAIEQNLVEDGLVARYTTVPGVDGLPPGEGTFMVCTFWLADNLHLMGRHEDARRIFERLLALRNDVGLLAEEYDTKLQRLVGNFPQAFSHIGLVNTALNLSPGHGPAEHRQDS